MPGRDEPPANCSLEAEIKSQLLRTKELYINRPDRVPSNRVRENEELLDCVVVTSRKSLKVIVIAHLTVFQVFYF